MSTVFEWSKHVWLSNGMVFKWGSENREKVYFMFYNVQYLNGSLNQLISPFGNRTIKCPKSQMLGFQVLIFRWLVSSNHLNNGLICIQKPVKLSNPQDFRHRLKS